MTRFERFTKQSQDAVARVYELLQPNKGNLVETYHLFFALLEPTDGLISQTLINMNIDVVGLRERLEDVLVANRNAKVYSKNAEQIYTTQQAKRIIELADEEADKLKDEYVSTWHMFLAILSERNTIVTSIISDFGITRSQVYDAIMNRRKSVEVEKTVFVSYRHGADTHLAQAIFNDLRSHGYNVFLDLNTKGQPVFDQIGLNQISARNYFILILSPNALTPCSDEQDLLRCEIEEAIRAMRNIVPVMEKDFIFQDEAKYLPLALQESLVKCKSLRLMNDNFEADMEILREQFLRQPIACEIMPINEDEQAVVNTIISKTIKTTQPD